MKTRNLSESQYQSTMQGRMRDVTGTAGGIDIWPYVAAIPREDLHGYQVFDDLDKLYGTGNPGA